LQVAQGCFRGNRFGDVSLKDDSVKLRFHWRIGFSGVKAVNSVCYRTKSDSEKV